MLHEEKIMQPSNGLENMIYLKNITFLVNDFEHISQDVNLLVDGNRIKQIGPDIPVPEADCLVIDCSNKIVAPGFINLHTHLYQNMLKGVADHLTLHEWCEEVTFPFVDVVLKDARSGDNRLSSYYGGLGAIEMVRSGITAFVDMDMLSDEMFDTWEKIGIRGTGAIQAVNTLMPEEFMSSDEIMRSDIISTIERWHNKGLQKIAIAPSTPYLCTPDYLLWLRDTSKEYGLKTYCHISETCKEVQESLRDTGMTPLQYLDSVGFLDYHLCAIHAVHFSKEDKKLAAERGVSVCYNPKSNGKLGSGIAPIVDYLDLGIKVGISTDGAASNDLLDMFEDMRFGLMLQKLKYEDPAVMTAKQVYQMATENAADIMGLDAGVLKEGKLADIIIMDTDTVHFGPVHDVIQQIVYCGKSSDVRSVIIDGKPVMLDGVIQTVPEKDFVKKAVALAEDRQRTIPYGRQYGK